MIWLLRHAEAADGEPDAERPLTEKGERQARTAGRALAVLEVRIDACVSSPKVRAVQTAELACEPLGVDVQVDDRLAGGPFDPFEVAEGRGEHVLLVGHDPDFSMAVHNVTGGQVRMKKGGVAGIDEGEMIVLMRPRELAAIATSYG
ncbi:MAG: SixA phosphatase family protein [Thermoleophilaceae bacterium]